MPLQARAINARRDTIVTGGHDTTYDQPAWMVILPRALCLPHFPQNATPRTTVTGTFQSAAEAFDAVVTDDMLVEMSVV